MLRGRARRLGVAATALAAAAAAASVSAAVLTGAHPDAFVLRRLVADPGFPAAAHDAQLVNAWGLAASPTGPWWTSNEARGTSTLYAGDGHKQALTVSVPCGPTGVVFNGGAGFVVRAGGRAAPARFLYACEDGTIRGWSPTVPRGWSTEAVVAVDATGSAAVFRGLALATLPGGSRRLYAADFHNGRVLAFDSRWRRVELGNRFADASIPSGYGPFNVYATGDRLFVSYAWRAPVNGNDAPSGGYVDEFDLQGHFVARVGRGSRLDEPWGLAIAPRGFGSLAGSLLVANFGTGRINAYARKGHGWTYRGQLERRDGKPLVVPGLWGIAFGTGGMSGPRTTLFVAAGPHRWHGASELAVHGLLGAIEPAG
jgi:uncharacterized protein (TIGR03118 family)